MLIAQISDLHVTAGEAPRQLMDAAASLRRAVAVLNTLEPRPDCVIATGDLVDDGLDAEYRVLFDILNALTVPLYLLPGNHDDAALLRMHLHLHGHLRADEPGHLGTVIDRHDVRLVLVDTTDAARHDGVFPDARAEWLDRTLRAKPHTPTLVAMHHPAFTTGIWWMDALGIEADHRARFEAIIRAHPQVRHVIAGHVHRTISRTWGDTVLTIAPSTAHQVACALGEGTSPQMSLEAPSFQLHHWTGDGFVTHTRPIEVPGHLDLGERMGGWPAMRDRLANGGPFLKHSVF